LAVTANGTEPFTYQWKKNGLVLSDGAGVSGSKTSTLNLSNLSATASAGDYTVEVTNAAGSIESQPASVTVVPMTGLSEYQTAVTGLNPVGYWQLDETTGPVAYEYWNGNSGTYGDAALPGVVGPQSPDFPGFSTTNLAAQFDGFAGSVQLPPLNLNTNKITITGWIWANGDQGGFKGIVYTRSGATTAGINYGNGNELRYVANNNAQNTWSWDSGLIVPPNDWSFFALVLDPDKTTIYLGNKSQGLVSATNNVPNANELFEGPTYVGQDPQGGRFFTGSIDDIAIFNQALTGDQINTLFTTATQGQSAGVTLTVEKSGNTMTLSWPTGVLQESATVDGTYADVNGATSPYPVQTTGQQHFYRVKVQ
jgi:hypothetical protein